MNDDQDGPAPAQPLADHVEKLRIHIGLLEGNLELTERWLGLRSQIKDVLRKNLRIAEDAAAREAEIAESGAGLHGERQNTEESPSGIRKVIDFWHEQLRTFEGVGSMLGQHQTRLLLRLEKAREELRRAERIPTDPQDDRER